MAINLDHGKKEQATGNLLAGAGARRRWSEIDLALTANGRQAHRTLTFNKNKRPVELLGADELSLAVTRTAGRQTIYEAAIPWKTLGAPSAPGPQDIVGIAATINDMDHPDQQDPCALGLFGGISPAKDPELFGSLMLAMKRAEECYLSGKIQNPIGNRIRRERTSGRWWRRPKGSTPSGKNAGATR